MSAAGTAGAGGVDAEEMWAGRVPRRWQAEALGAALGAMRSGVKRPLIQACTGAGKSVVVGRLAYLAKGDVLVTTPTQALVDQLGETIEAHCPGEVGAAYQHRWDVAGRRVVVTCNASLGRLLVERPSWAVWVCDEAHRMEGDALRLLRPVSRVAVGLTATPFRADRRGLETWDKLVYAYTSADAVRDRVLVPWRVVRWDGETGSATGDVDELTVWWARQAVAEVGPGIVSATSVWDARMMARRLMDAGVKAAAIHGQMPRHERKRLLGALEVGALGCLVHVQLLTEGVDLPWLRWLVLRRPVGSPVRLVQEVGRVLRACEGKDEALLFDPHDLLGRLGLVHAAALEDAARGGEDEGEEDGESSDVGGEGADGEAGSGVGRDGRVPRAVAVSRLEGWITDVLGALRGVGLAPPAGWAPDAEWRQERASGTQLSALGKMTWALRYYPDEEGRNALKWVVEQAAGGGVRRGTASDLLSVCMAFADASQEARAVKRHWRCEVPLPPVPVVVGRKGAMVAAGGGAP